MTKRQRSSSIVVCERPRKKKCRRVQFRNDVKKHDGLKPQTKIFEELILAYTINGETVDAKSLLLFLESKNLLHILEPMRIEMENTILRTQNSRKKKRHINPMLTGGGGHGYGIMPRDIPSLILIRDLLNCASKMMIEYKVFVKGEEETAFGHSPNSIYGTPVSEPLSLELS